jgi:hypothetical protein
VRRKSLSIFIRIHLLYWALTGLRLLTGDGWVTSEGSLCGTCCNKVKVGHVLFGVTFIGFPLPMLPAFPLLQSVAAAVGPLAAYVSRGVVVPTATTMISYK